MQEFASILNSPLMPLLWTILIIVGGTIVIRSKAFQGILKVFITPILRLVFAAEAKAGKFSKLVFKLYRLIPSALRPKTAEEWELHLDNKYASSEDPLLRGDLKAAALVDYPEEKHPEMYLRQPDDMRRSLIRDGRMPNGDYPSIALGSTFITNELINRFIKIGIVNAAWVGLLVAFIVITFAPPSALTTAVTVPAGMYEVVADAWTDAEAQTLREASAEAQKAFVERANTIYSVLTFVSSTVLTAVLIILSMVATFHSKLSSGVGAYAQRRVEPLSKKQKESTVKYKYEMDLRAIEDTAYSDALKILRDFDHSPTITLGVGTGTFKFRGKRSSYSKYQPIKMSQKDLMQHTFVFGGSGEGKTRTILIPVIRQILELRKEGAKKNDGVPTSTIYATDGKAVLYNDVVAVAEELGMGDDIRVVGADPEMYGVDLLEGVEPLDASNMLKSAMKQAQGSSGGGKTDYFVGAAEDVIYHSAMIARAWEVTDGGINRQESTNHRAYCIAEIFRLLLDDKLLFRAIDDVTAAILDDSEIAICDFETEQLKMSIKYMITAWPQMADGQRSGVIGSVNTNLSDFMKNPSIFHKFATGCSKGKKMKITDFLDPRNITCIALSSLDNGSAATITNVFLKSMLYKESMKQLKADRDIAKKRQIMFLADEVQELLTADKVGMSDTNFWGMARETGMYGFVATQTFSSVVQVLGAEATKAMLNNFRSKIFLRSEDEATVDYCQKIMGKTLRSYTFEDDRYESLDSFLMECGLPENPAFWTKEVHLQENEGALSLAHLITPSKIEFVEARKIYTADYAAQTASGFADPNTRAQMEMTAMTNKIAAQKEEHNMAIRIMSEGNHEADLIKPADIMEMGRGHAVVMIQRAGMMRADIMRIG